MDTILQDVIVEIQAEICRQDAKWGSGRVLEKKTWLMVLMEEVGEVARAVHDHDMENYREELVQVAAVCIQALSSLEKEQNDYYS